MTGPAAISVLIVTCNHEAFIAQAIDSVLAQDCSVPFEIIVSEDASSDRTRDILRDYQKACPDRIELILSERNLRSNEVVARGLRRARGQYVCLLDGDDCWTSRNKLQWQFDFLERYRDVSAVFGNALVERNGTSGRTCWTSASQPSLIGLDGLWEGNPFATCAGMMRLGCLRDLSAAYAGFFPITDWPLYVLCARHGPIAFLDEVVGVYRLHAGGMFSSLAAKAKRDQIEDFYRRITTLLPDADALAVRRGCSRYFIDQARALAAGGDLMGALDCLRRSYRSGDAQGGASFMAACRIMLDRVRYAL